MATFTQSGFDDWEAEAFQALGYYPGHEPDCDKRMESFLTSKCGCGPVDPDAAEKLAQKKLQEGFERDHEKELSKLDFLPDK